MNTAFPDTDLALTALHDRVDVVVFFGPSYSHGDKPWRVKLALKNKDTKVEIENEGKSLALAIGGAWDKLQELVEIGLPKGTLTPTAIDKPDLYAQLGINENIPNDDIPLLRGHNDLS